MDWLTSCQLVSLSYVYMSFIIMPVNKKIIGREKDRKGRRDREVREREREIESEEFYIVELGIKINH